MIVFGFMLQPRSLGSVHIVSQNPFFQPLLDLNMYSDGPVTDPNSDAFLTVSFYKIMRNIAFANEGIPLYPPLADYVSDDQLLTDAKNKIIAESHIVGTTRMGTSTANGVVNGNLQVFGVKNLMIADAGVLPILSSGNTCYSAYLVGLEAAAILGVPTPPAL